MSDPFAQPETTRRPTRVLTPGPSPCGERGDEAGGGGKEGMSGDERPREAVTWQRRTSTDVARRLRREPTPAEAALWNLLRGAAIGERVRKQQPIGPYVVGFWIGAVDLVIELDGTVHDRPEVATQDAHRSAYLQASGMSILRFRNDEVLSDPDHCLRQNTAELSRLHLQRSGEAPK